MSNESADYDTGMNHEQARERLMEAVEAIHDVESNYDELTDEMGEMLSDAKSGVAAVHFHADDKEVIFDL